MASLAAVAGAFAGLVLTTTAGDVAIGRLAIEDAAAGLLLSIALLGLSEPLLSRRTGFPWLFYAALAAAIASADPPRYCCRHSSRSRSPC